MSPPGLAAAFALVLVAAIGCYIVLISYNAVVAVRLRIDKAWSNIDVIPKQRHDQLPNLVAAVRDLMAFERDTLTRVTEARAPTRRPRRSRTRRPRPRKRARPCGRSSR
jgi:hypothetical protein